MMEETEELRALGLVKDMAIMMYQAHEKKVKELEGKSAALAHLTAMEQCIAVQNWLAVQRMRVILLTDDE